MITFEQLLLEVSIDQLRHDWVDAGKMSADVFELICQCTNNQSAYTTWMVKRIGDSTNSLETFNYFVTLDERNRAEIIQSYQKCFDTFTKYKQRFEKKDINQYHDLGEWAEKCHDVQEAVEAKQREKNVDRFKIGSVVASNGVGYLVYKLPKGHPENRQIAIELGRKAAGYYGWCTSYDGNLSFWDDHIAAEDLYIFINPKDRLRDKFQLEYNYCKDKLFPLKTDEPLSDEEIVDYLPFYDFLHEKEGRPIPPFVDNVRKLQAAIADPVDSTLDMFKIADGIYRIDRTTVRLNSPRTWIKAIGIELLGLPEDKLILASKAARDLCTGGNQWFISTGTAGEFKCFTVDFRWNRRTLTDEYSLVCKVPYKFSNTGNEFLHDKAYDFGRLNSEANNEILYDRIITLQNILHHSYSNLTLNSVIRSTFKEIARTRKAAAREAERVARREERVRQREADRAARQAARAAGQLIPGRAAARTVEIPEELRQYHVTTEGSANFYSIPATNLEQTIHSIYSGEDFQVRGIEGQFGLVIQKGIGFFISDLYHGDEYEDNLPVFRTDLATGRLMLGTMNPDRVYDIYKKFKEADDRVQYPPQIQAIANLKEGRLDRYLVDNIGHTSKLYMFPAREAERWVPYSLPSGWNTGNCRQVYLGYISKWQFTLTDTGKFILTGRWGSGGSRSWIDSVPGLAETLVQICRHYDIPRAGVLQTLQEMCNTHYIPYPDTLRRELLLESMENVQNIGKNCIDLWLDYILD